MSALAEKGVAPRADRDDQYPSRQEPVARFLPRREPTVYGTADAGPLSQSQLDEFDANGFLILPGLFSADEIDACLAEVEVIRSDDDMLARPEAIIEPDDSALRSLFAVHRLSDFFGAVSSDERIVRRAMQVLGSDIYITQSRINLKPGFNGKEFNWHSDFETWHVEDGMPRMRAVSCSILLTENNAHNGSLMLVPGSHRRFLTCVGETPDDHYQHSLRRQEFGIPDNDNLRTMINAGGLTSALGPRGTVILFDCNIMHGSGSNISPWPRSNLFFVYNSVENRLQRPFCNKTPRPEFIAARDDCPPVRPTRYPNGRETCPEGL